jgi:SPP1 gp7 family putative phage head morphogenesis protein
VKKKFSAATKAKYKARESKWKPPRLIEMRYLHDLKMILAGFCDAVEGILSPVVKEYFGRNDSSEARLDAFFDDVQKAFQRINGLLAQLSTKVPKPFQRMADAVLAHVNKAIKIPHDVSPTLKVKLGVVLEKNRNLITKAAQEYVNQVRTVITAPENAALNPETIKSLLQTRRKVVESRAILIGKDQTLKLNGTLIRDFQIASGVEHYMWSTCLDDRVRPTHAALEGKVLRWSDPPPPPGYPGDDINCRCVGIPVEPSDLM